MNLNKQHISKVRTIRKQIFDDNSNSFGYSFILNKKLGKNGLIYDHELKGKKIKLVSKVDNDDREIGSEYTIENVYLHYENGYYLVILYVNDSNSHGSAIIENLNSNCEFINESVSNFKKKYKFI